MCATNRRLPGAPAGTVWPPMRVLAHVGSCFVGGRSEVIGHAFISYAREDSHRVDQLQQVLEAAGIPVWRDTADLRPGEDWRAKIRHAITDNALVFLACFSQVSLNRDRSYQNEELLLAIEQSRLRSPDYPWLIPVRFDECDIPDRDIGGGRTLASIHRADLFGDHSAEGAARLVESVRRTLGSGSNAAAARPEPEVGTPTAGTSESRITHSEVASVMASTAGGYNNVPEVALQARLVNAWCGDVRPTSEKGHHVVTVIVQNSSDDPIYQLRIAVGAEWSQDISNYTELDMLVVVPPRYHQQHAVSAPVDFRSDKGYGLLPPVEMIFGDTAGRFWYRDRHGGLAQIRNIPFSATESFFTKPLGKKNVLEAVQRSQAQLVNAWCDDVQPASGNGNHLATVTVQNSSDDPIYGLRVAIGAGWSRHIFEYVELDLLYVVPPRCRQQRAVSVRLNSPSGGGYDQLPVEMIFSDVAGRFWRRDRYGSLAQIRDIPPLAFESLFVEPILPWL
jgi:hypothetical protein